MIPLRLLLLFLILAGGLAQAATSYRVQRGDTLIGIAARAGVSQVQIRRANPRLRGDTVRLGQRLQIPNRQLAAKRHHVRPGENLTTIAHRFGLSAGELLRANPQYRGGKTIRAGAVLRIPPRLVAARIGQSGHAGPSGRGAATPVAAATPRPARRAGAAVIQQAGIRVSPAGRSQTGWLWPVPGYHHISSGFGERELDGEDAMHYGVDIVAPTGTPVLAARPGHVLESRADFARGWGWTVVVQHPDGWITRYAHLSRNLVRSGDAVVQGQRIGLVGSTGHSTGPHLHYGTYLRWNPKNPAALY